MNAPTSTTVAYSRRMPTRTKRREAIKQLTFAGAGFTLSPTIIRGQPLHLRSGAILPLGPVREYVEQQVEAPMTVVVFPGADGIFSLDEDDGRSFDYRKGEWMRIEMLPPERRTIEVRLAGSRDVKRVTFEGKPVEVRL